MNAVEVTLSQHCVAEAIENLTDQFGYPPTISEIAIELGYKSANAAMEHVKALIKKGVVSSVPNKARTLKVKREYYFKPFKQRIATEGERNAN